MTETAVLDRGDAAPPSDRFRSGPGIRILRITAETAHFLAEFDRILRVAVADFVRRAQDPDTTEPAVWTALQQAPFIPWQGCWLVVTDTYRLLGFGLVALGREVWGPPSAVVAGLYLYPRRTPRSACPLLLDAMAAWARAQGATCLVGGTHRTRWRAWRRLGITPAGMVIRKEL
jgi:GNAT superfamily N-acetyltransferase